MKVLPPSCFPISRHGIVGASIPGVRRRPFDSAADQVGAKSILVQDRHDTLRDLIRIFGINCYGSDAPNLRHRSPIAGENRAAAGHGLDNRKTEAFVEGWVEKHLGRTIELDKITVVDVSDERDRSAGRRLPGARPNPDRIMTIAAGNDQPEVGAKRVNPFKRSDRTLQILPFFDRPSRQQKRGPADRSAANGEEPMVDTRIGHPDDLLDLRKVFAESIACEGGNHKNAIGAIPPDRLRCSLPSLKGESSVDKIFFEDHQIMDRDDAGKKTAGRDAEVGSMIDVTGKTPDDRQKGAWGDREMMGNQTPPPPARGTPDGTKLHVVASGHRRRQFANVDRHSGPLQTHQSCDVKE